MEESWQRKGRYTSNIKRKKNHVDIPEMRLLFKKKCRETVENKYEKKKNTFMEQINTDVLPLNTNEVNNSKNQEQIDNKKSKNVEEKFEINNAQENVKEVRNEFIEQADNGIKILEKTVSSDMNLIKMNKLFNGLIKDIHYYMVSTSCTLTVSKHSTDQSLSIDTFELTTKEFST